MNLSINLTLKTSADKDSIVRQDINEIKFLNADNEPIVISDISKFYECFNSNQGAIMFYSVDNHITLVHMDNIASLTIISK